ncbi:hypothetical protein [Bradyrhizobium sp. McL0616]|uniref:hypothetical protein n=1 Tax=Bradyrhizobium sp. McL0616 TaxID=3415674 RepID=UPI003CE9BC33
MAQHQLRDIANDLMEIFRNRNLADRLYLPQARGLRRSDLSMVVAGFSRDIVAWRPGPTMRACEHHGQT